MKIGRIMLNRFHSIRDYIEDYETFEGIKYTNNKKKAYVFSEKEARLIMHLLQKIQDEEDKRRDTKIMTEYVVEDD